MEDMSLILKSDALIVSMIGGLIGMIGILISIVWQNFKNKLVSTEAMTKLINRKVEMNQQKNTDILEKVKIKQTGQNFQIDELKRNNINIENQLNHIRQDLNSLPSKIIKMQKNLGLYK
ncbi:MAG: hypothetical protein JJV97_06185 [SAR324 cluster bacterium]|nr:hypothetical protein [SAR324 cluster bacterium]